MTNDRIDELLDSALLSGQVPGDATAPERAELEKLLQAMGILQSDRTALDQESAASLPAARARFQRYVAQTQPTRSAASAPPALPGRSMLGRLFAGGALRPLTASAAVIALLVVALVAWRAGLGGTESAYAQVVRPGDYVQVEGVVDESQDGLLRLSSELGPLEVQVTENTSLVDGGSPVAASNVGPGDRVLVTGTAGENRTLLAQTVALGQRGDGSAPRVVSFKRLKHLGQTLEGQVLTFTVSSDGKRGAVLLQAGDGQRYLVPIDGPAAERILSRAATALGQQVRISEASGVTSGTFTVDLPEPGAGSPGPGSGQGAGQGRGRPTLVSVQGVITAVERRPAAGSRPAVTILTVRTTEGTAAVAIRPQARIFPGQSGLDVSKGLTTDAIGHAVSIAGGRERATGTIVADIVLLGRSLER